jgi:hypothetical protein
LTTRRVALEPGLDRLRQLLEPVALTDGAQVATGLDRIGPGERLERREGSE